MTTSLTTDYVGNKIYENGNLKRVLVDGGYIEGGKYHYYLTDHLGNNRTVVEASGAIIQQTQYYPFGMAFAENVGMEKQPYKYNNKELDTKHGLNMYDYSARYLDNAVPRFSSVDPHAENYYSWSPYVYVGNNPMRLTDPTGMDWYEDEDGMYQYDPDVSEKSKLKKGQFYIGKTAQVNDSKGNAFANFRKDGSIMFTNEAAAYARMITQSYKLNGETMSVISNDGVLYLPDYNQKDKGSYTLSDYGYSTSSGNIIDSSGGKINTLATAHTHPDGGGLSYSDYSFGKDSTPGKPVYAFMLGNWAEKQNYIQGLVVPKGQQSYTTLNVTRNNPHINIFTISHPLPLGYSLRDFYKKHKK